eukprot:93824-Pyramimonas_sp.AAC.1
MSEYTDRFTNPQEHSGAGRSSARRRPIAIMAAALQSVTKGGRVREEKEDSGTTFSGTDRDPDTSPPPRGDPASSKPTSS